MTRVKSSLKVLLRIALAVVLTGETGTGKSIIIGAISLLCGGRAKTSSIGKRSDTAYVEGVFFLSNLFLKIFSS